MIPPSCDAEFVAAMEDVLGLYELPPDPRRPQLCMDEQPVQLIKETRTPIPATAGRPRRVDYEYERNGTASIFLFCEPKTGWREAAARPTRTKVDWAHEVARLLETRYADCDKLTLICDNLSTHTRGAIYQAFEPRRARALLERLDLRHTPKHGSWLNIAENELSVMTRQCLKDRRLGDLAVLQAEIAAWSARANAKQRGVDWQMKINDARCKLKSIYPNIEP